MSQNTLSADVVSKEFFRNNEVFSDLMNYALYDGQQVIKANELTDEDTDLSASIDGISINRNEDIIKSIHHQEYFMLCSLENQKAQEKDMVIRALQYVALLYHKQMNRIKDSNYPQKELYPVNLIVNYEGEGKWHQPTSLKEYFKHQPLIQNLFTDFNYIVVNLRNMDYKKIHNIRLKKLSNLIHQVYNKSMEEELEYIDYDIAQVAAAITGNTDFDLEFKEGDRVPMTFFQKQNMEINKLHNQLQSQISDYQKLDQENKTLKAEIEQLKKQLAMK